MAGANGGGTALAVPEKAGALSAPVSARLASMREGMAEASELRKIVGQYVRQHMVLDIDYGTIPGTPKPTLYKPGAERITDLFRCTPQFEVTHRVEDWERGLFHYEFRCRLVSRDAGEIVAEGVGSANSREGRYRWRNASRKCPSCGAEAIIKGKAEYGGGWVCFKKKSGCGAKWNDGAEEIEGQEAGKVENDDVFTLVNTILKMAKKRAHVDAALAIGRCSDLFTQDVEDLQDPRLAADAPARREEPPAGGAGDIGDGEDVPSRYDLLAGSVSECETLDALREWAQAANTAHRKKQTTDHQHKTLTGLYSMRKGELDKKAAASAPAEPGEAG